MLVHNNPQTSTKGWKFNNNLLQVKEFQQQVKNMIKEIKSSDMSDLNKWEWLKFQIKQLAIITGKKLSVARRKKQTDLIKKINSLMEKGCDFDHDELHILQVQLDEMYTIKANGAYIRSRANWIEQGEKSNS